MKIKSLVLALMLAGTSVAFAQKGEVSSAKTNYEKFAQFKSVNTAALGVSALNTAKASADKAVANEKTMNDPTAWSYRALIYADLGLMDSVNGGASITEAQKSIEKATSLDKDGANKANIENAKNLIAQYSLNAGVRAYQRGKFPEAKKAFEAALVSRPGDTTLTYYAGLSAINAKDYKGAIPLYEQLTKTKYSANNQVYLDLSRLYLMQGDTTSAIRVAGEGAAKYNDNALATQEIELNLMSGKEKEVITKIEAQAAKNPTNKSYPYYLGIAYNTAKNYEKAEAAYKKAIEIDPNFADAYINLGGLILNKGINTYNTAGKLPASKQKEYDAMIKTAMADFDRAFPYLEKATQVNPKSSIAWENLKTYYVVKKNQAKVDEINKKLAGL